MSHFHQKKQKLPAVGIFTLFSHLLHVSLLPVTTPSRKGCEYHQLLSAHPLKLAFCLHNPSPQMGVLIRAPASLLPGTLQGKQRRFGPFQMAPEASVGPLISKEQLTKRTRSERPANISGRHQRERSVLPVQQALVAHLCCVVAVPLAIAADIYTLSPSLQRSRFGFVFVTAFKSFSLLKH